MEAELLASELVHLRKAHEEHVKAYRDEQKEVAEQLSKLTVAVAQGKVVVAAVGIGATVILAAVQVLVAIPWP